MDPRLIMDPRLTLDLRHIMDPRLTLDHIDMVSDIILMDLLLMDLLLMDLLNMDSLTTGPHMVTLDTGVNFNYC
jgi:hypothetical protein